MRRERQKRRTRFRIFFTAKQVVSNLQRAIEDRTLSISGLRAVGVLAQVTFVRGDGVVELVLALEDLADLKLREHREFRALATSLVGDCLRVVAFEECRERRDRLLAFAVSQIRRTHLIRGDHGPTMLGISREKPVQRGNSEAKLRVVGRGRYAERERDLEKRRASRVLRDLRVDLLQISREIHPRQTRHHGLPGEVLRLAEMVAGLSDLRPFGRFLDVQLESLDRARMVACGLAGASHRVEELGPQDFPLRERSCLSEQGVRPFGIGGHRG